jgi:hypothetical protein
VCGRQCMSELFNGDVAVSREHRPKVDGGVGLGEQVDGEVDRPTQAYCGKRETLPNRGKARSRREEIAPDIDGREGRDGTWGRRDREPECGNNDMEGREGWYLTMRGEREST